MSLDPPSATDIGQNDAVPTKLHIGVDQRSEWGANRDLSNPRLEARRPLP